MDWSEPSVASNTFMSMYLLLSKGLFVFYAVTNMQPRTITNELFGNIHAKNPAGPVPETFRNFTCLGPCHGHESQKHEF